VSSGVLLLPLLAVLVLFGASSYEGILFSKAADDGACVVDDRLVVFSNDMILNS
jgi:hypothetical protein